MRGGGIELTADLSGWRALPSVGRLRDNYFRLALLVREGGQILTVLVDNEQPTATLEDVCMRETANYRQAGTVEVLDRERVAGRPVCAFTFVGGPTSDRSLFVEFLAEGKWIGFHYSAPEASWALERARSALRSIMTGLSVRRYEMGTDELMVDVTDDERRFMWERLACPYRDRLFFCRALRAFAAGHRPTGRPEPVGMAGVEASVPGPGAAFNGKPTVTANYLVLHDRGARMGPIDAPNQVEPKDIDELMQASVSGDPVASSNGAITYARNLRETSPAAPAAQSLVWGRGRRTRYVRDTSMGVIVFESGPDRFAVAVFPSLQPAPASGVARGPTLPPWAHECSAQLAAAASKNPAFKRAKIVERNGRVAEVWVEFPEMRALAVAVTVKNPGPPPKVTTEWFSPPRSNEPGFMLVKASDGRQVTVAGADAQDPLREDFERTFKPILEKCLQP